jgi:hypothetical protein
MATYTIELDEAQTAKAEELAAYYKMSVEAILKEGAENCLYNREERMISEKADPLGLGDAVRGSEARLLAQREEMKRTGFWKKKVPGERW